MFTNSTPEIFNAMRFEQEQRAQRQQMLREVKDACRPAAVTRPNRWSRTGKPVMPSLGRIFAHGRA